ncbi:NAD(P)/FAD-dependent oxidoreductase, partial [Aeromicrobium sp.]|uniref:NAD(P)/FAD-dependent oxidoreductase n=1 Tax=Aeromicrobium sp. TaxID=1871063 RepID=UPI003C461864
MPVAYLRTLEDSRRLRDAFQPGRQIAIIGGGWIGLEVAAAARSAGSDVTVVESLDLPLVRVLGPEVATTFARLHRAHGVDLRLDASVDSFAVTSDGRAALRLADGSQLTADLVVVGVGVEPNATTASSAGLDVDNGILVDERLRTSDPQVFAVGDVANHLHPTLGRRIRVEHWDTAIHQGRTAAGNMLGGDEAYT